MDKFRIIYHIDMNSYFASCEQQANPFLRGKPVGVCEHLGGIIIAPSIEAKKMGIKTATPVWEAKKLCPGIILLHTDPEKYRSVTHKFLKIFLSYTEHVQKLSIDEAFLDMTDTLRSELRNKRDPWVRAEQIALEIKSKIKKSAGEWINCSIGIGPDKLIAKIASDMRKPDGLVIVRPENKQMLYDNLKLTDIPGIGSRTEKNLNLIGIRALKDLRDYPEPNLVAHFGVMGRHLHNIGKLEGSWYEHEFEKEQEIKSMGHAYTLPQATYDKKTVLQVLYRLSEMVGRRLRAAGLCGDIVHFIANGKSGGYSGKSKKIGYFISDGRDIFLESSALFLKNSVSWPLRLVGVTVAGLKAYAAQQPLFEQEKRKNRLMRFLDTINDKYGDFTIARIPAWQARNFIRDSIGFGRMKEFKINYKNRR